VITKVQNFVELIRFETWITKLFQFKEIYTLLVLQFGSCESKHKKNQIGKIFI